MLINQTRDFERMLRKRLAELYATKSNAVENGVSLELYPVYVESLRTLRAVEQLIDEVKSEIEAGR